jgi:hypothetical protein
LKYVRTLKETNEYKIPQSKKSHKNDKPSFMSKQPKESDEEKNNESVEEKNKKNDEENQEKI